MTNLVLKTEEIEIYDEIGICVWYQELINNYWCDADEIMRKADRKVVSSLIQELGYYSIYFPESRIYGVSTLFDGIRFECNCEIHQGLVNIYLISKDVNTGQQIGNSIILICRMIEIQNESDSGRYMLLPRFKDYTDLHNLLKLIYLKFEEYKVAVYNSNIFSLNSETL